MLCSVTCGTSNIYEATQILGWVVVERVPSHSQGRECTCVIKARSELPFMSLGLVEKKHSRPSSRRVV